MRRVTAECRVGDAEVLRALPEVVAAAAAWGQEYEAADVAYFLAKPARLRREPVMVLLHEDGGELAGAVLVFRYGGILRGLYSSSNRRGRRTVFAPVGERVEAAAIGARTLVEGGARLVSIDIEMGVAPEPADSRSEAVAGLRLAGLAGAEWALHRGVKGFDMPLAADYDATLAGLGKRTRRNLRYYERMCLGELRCRFVAEVSMSLEELKALNAECNYKVAEAELRWRLLQPAHPVRVGLQDGQGRWVAVLGGRRNGGGVEIDWQMNRRGLEKYSLTTALRSALIRDEVGRGSTSLLAEGGTVHSMAESFRPRAVYNLALRRGSLGLRILEWGLAKFYPGKTISQAVHKPWRVWRHCRFPQGTRE